MPTRTDVIARQIASYDKIIAADRTVSDVELAIFKIAICQLVDAVFSGGGGGGSTSASTIASGVDASADINSILATLQSIDTKLIQEADIISAIQTAADIDTIITRLTSLDNNKLTQSGVESAIQSAADIDTIITRLSSIVTNTSNISAGGSSVNTVSSYNRTTAVITDAGGTIIAANANRKHAIIVNRSANVCDLFFGTIGAFGEGLPLEPKQPYEINNSNLFLGAVRGITAGGLTASLAVLEGT